MTDITAKTAMKRADMVRQGAEELFMSEDAVEHALALTANLASSLSRMRVNSQLSAVIGQEAVSSVAEAVMALSNARGALVKAHGALKDVQTQIGCRTVAYGTQYEKPDGDDTRIEAEDNIAA
ncbi:hypothetical protein PQU92_09430 [Asticcacaulis sp. BYS171W]|uniref:Uncharacterized protein n=1 Tax=Asticcacaulis aquaticus TaxID=2984212 RepID=A0ABT5HVN4_9CAUL|nr:hypothetical protein [Asticcacaulis aquaticus]MDC7683496.1 hypothetical protein [Asticcacaulis aquaticus]